MPRSDTAAARNFAVVLKRKSKMQAETSAAQPDDCFSFLGWLNPKQITMKSPQSIYEQVGGGEITMTC